MDERRLVAVRRGINQSGAVGRPPQHRSDEHVGFDIHHHDVLPVTDPVQGGGRARFGDTGGFHHHVDVAREQDLGVFGEDGAAARDRLVHLLDRVRADHRRRGIPCVRKGPHSLLPADIRDDGGPHAADAGELADHHRAEAPGADDPDAHGPAGGLAGLQLPVHPETVGRSFVSDRRSTIRRSRSLPRRRRPPLSGFQPRS